MLFVFLHTMTYSCCCLPDSHDTYLSYWLYSRKGSSRRDNLCLQDMCLQVTYFASFFRRSFRQTLHRQSWRTLTQVPFSRFVLAHSNGFSYDVRTLWYVISIWIKCQAWHGEVHESQILLISCLSLWLLFNDWGNLIFDFDLVFLFRKREEKVFLFNFIFVSV